ncbi:MAG: GTP cyclohydrolase I [Polyangiaceae bacterium]
MKRSIDESRAKRALAEFLSALGYDPSNPELSDTPARVVDAYLSDLVAGEDVDIQALIETGAVPGASECLVVVSDIAVCSLCPHHLLPAEGTATVVYAPGERLLGLGTVAALVSALSRRLTLQERITESVVSALMTHAKARGAYCCLRLDHACLRLRGQRQTRATVRTAKTAGILLEPRWSDELSRLLGGQP